MRIKKNKLSTGTGRSLFESLEPRQLLSAVTQTQLSESTGASRLGQDVTFTATVSTQSQGSPTGFVRFLDGTTLLGKVDLNTTGQASLDVYSLFKGTHTITAKYVANGTFAKSTSAVQTLVVNRGPVTVAGNGLAMSTTGTGSGVAAADGQSLQVDYTGYLTNGSKFDSSLNANRFPFGFTLGQGHVIAGWDQGLVGLQPGQTRVLLIPPALGYGAQGSGSSIPPNSKLIFVVKLLSLEAPTTPTLTITGTNSEPISYGEAPLAQDGTDFGAVPVDSASNTITIILGEGNSTNLFITQAATVTGLAASDYTISQPGQDANGNESFTIQFHPSATGVRNARVNLFTNDAAHPSFHIKLTGTGV